MKVLNVHVAPQLAFCFLLAAAEVHPAAVSCDSYPFKLFELLSVLLLAAAACKGVEKKTKKTHTLAGARTHTHENPHPCPHLSTCSETLKSAVILFFFPPQAIKLFFSP